MAFALAGRHAHRWHSAFAIAGAHYGAASLRLAGSVRAAHRHPRPAEYFVQSGGRTNRQSRRGGLFDLSALSHRCSGSRPDQSNQARRGAAEGGQGMLKKRGKIQRGLIMFGSTFGSMAELSRGLWQSDAHRRWLMPVAIFLCLTGLLLILATTVEALAPFIYAIF